MNAIAFNQPDNYNLLLGPHYKILNAGSMPPWDFVHLFVNDLAKLEDDLFELRTLIASDGMIWVSWYKKSAKKPTEITEDLIRDTCLPLGLVDVKVCSVSEDWSGLKLVIRKELR